MEQQHLIATKNNAPAAISMSLNPVTGNLIKLRRQAIRDFERKLQNMLCKPPLEKEQWLDNLKAQLSSIKSRGDDIYLHSLTLTRFQMMYQVM